MKAAFDAPEPVHKNDHYFYFSPVLADHPSEHCYNAKTKAHYYAKVWAWWVTKFSLFFFCSTPTQGRYCKKRNRSRKIFVRICLISESKAVIASDRSVIRDIEPVQKNLIYILHKYL